MKHVSELLQLLDLEEIEKNLFRGQSVNIGSPMVFGGQVLAQAVVAAMRTVPDDRSLHSLHSYFILPGDFNKPIVYTVDVIRDGGSFATRRVKAIQNGRDIFLLSCSFQTPQEGFDHQIEMPDVPPPEQLRSQAELRAELRQQYPDMPKVLGWERPIEFRPVEVIDPFKPEKSEPFRHIWLRSKGRMPDNSNQHLAVLSYASDYNLLWTAMLPHRDQAGLRDIFMASLDHAMWFHREFRADEWLLYVLDSPSASSGRGFCRGNFFNRDGKLVASVTQEGLMRKRRR
ncbi:MAG: acyl-CoA thioesterase II [Saprospiraceae bacterium]